MMKRFMSTVAIQPANAIHRLQPTNVCKIRVSIRRPTLEHSTRHDSSAFKPECDHILLRPIKWRRRDECHIFGRLDSLEQGPRDLFAQVVLIQCNMMENFSQRPFVSGWMPVQLRLGQWLKSLERFSADLFESI